MGIGQSWATPENDYSDGERSLHISGTRDRGDKIDFWLFRAGRKPCRIRCGICKEPMDGHEHCPRCIGEAL